jgi:hypothetical protein
MKRQIPNDKGIFPCPIMREHVRTALRDCVAYNAQQCAMRIQTQLMVRSRYRNRYNSQSQTSFVKD